MKRATWELGDELFEFHDEEIIISSIGVVVESTISEARHIDIATAVGGDAVSKIKVRSPELLGPLLGSPTVVLTTYGRRIRRVRYSVTVFDLNCGAAVGSNINTIVQSRSASLLVHKCAIRILRRV